MEKSNLRVFVARTIDDQEYSEWLETLHPDDSASFAFYRGDDVHSRFLFAFQRLTEQFKIKDDRAIMEAFAAATGKAPGAFGARQEAQRLWEHPSVIDMIARWRYRQNRMAGLRIRQKYAQIVEDLADTAAQSEDTQERIAIASEILKYVRLESEEARHDEMLRVKRGLDDQRTIQSTRKVKQLAPVVPESKEVAKSHLRMLQEKLGADAIMEAIAKEDVSVQT
jgi:hypothetical protein